MDRRAILTLTTIVAAALFGVAGYLWSRAPGTIEPPAIIDDIRIANAGQLSVLNLIAQDRNLFASNGLDAEIREYDAGVNATQALLDGEADVAVGAEFVGVRNMFTNDDLRILSQVAARDRDVFRLVARRDAGIASPAQLKGKKIGVTAKSAGEFYLWRLLISHGLSLNDVVRVDLSPSEMIEAVGDGTVDAAIGFEPTAYLMEIALGTNAIAWSAQGDVRAYGLAYTTRSFAERHPEAVERYLRALSQAATFVKDRPSEARAIVARMVDADEPYMAYVWDKLQPGLHLDQDLLLTMEMQARWTIANGLTDERMVPNYLDRIYFDALEKAAPGATTILH